MQDGFSFGGHSTAEFYMHAEKYPDLGGTKRKRKVIPVPGRSGDLHLDEDAFENYPQKYECYFHDPRRTAPEMAHAVQGWLLGSAEQRRLEDPYDPDHFRLATFVGPLNVANILNRYGRCVVEFDCAPQCYLKSGEIPIDFESPGSIYNPTAFKAQPLIHVYGTGTGTVTVGNKTVEILQIQESLSLDCEMQNAYYGQGDVAENKNNCVSAQPFPVLLPGYNAVTFTGDIRKVTVIPRWWEA